MVPAGDAEPPLQSQLQLQSKNVCVVGAGMAGMAAARELRREGHAVTVIEQSVDVGGQWLYYDPTTDGDDLLEATEPVRVASSMYACLRLISPREAMGFSDFQFLPRHGVAGRDPHRYPVHREMYCYLRDFCDAFGLLDAVRLNTRVLRVAAAVPASSLTRQWAVRSVHLGDGDEKEEVFEAVVVATGRYSQPKLPSIVGMEEWRRRQMHSHSYRTPEPFRGDVVIMVGCGDSGKRHRAGPAPRRQGGAPHRQVHGGGHVQDAGQPRQPPPPSAHRRAAGRRARGVRRRLLPLRGHGHALHGVRLLVTVPRHGRRGHRGRQPRRPAVRARVSAVPGAVALLRRRTEEGHYSVVLRGAGEVDAQVLSGRRALPPEEEMLRSVEEHYRAREAAGVPKKYTHDIGGVEPLKMYEFGEKYCDFARIENWQRELILSGIAGMNEDMENFRDRTDDSENVRKGLQTWHSLAAPAQAQDDKNVTVKDIAATEVDVQAMTKLLVN
ncbi:hypothetical protein ACQ4PT_003361 [Festuca glaucescens]